MNKKWMIPVVSLVLLSGIAISWYFTSDNSESKPMVTINHEDPTFNPSARPVEQQQQTSFTPDTFAQLQTIDQETIRDFVQKVRRLGAPQVTPADCSLLALEDAHFAITSFWDPAYIRNASFYETTMTNTLWDPLLKADITKPGAWMVAMLTESKESNWQGVVLRWDAPPSTLISPPVSLPEPIAQACNSGWNELLKQNYPFFSFVKATATQNILQLHFTVVKTDKPQTVVVDVPINGTYKSWSLGNISIRNE